MPQPIVPRSFVGILQQLRTFTERSYDNFVVLVAGFLSLPPVRAKEPGWSQRRTERRTTPRRAGKKERTRAQAVCEPEHALRKKTELGAELILLAARRWPHLQMSVAADHAYNCKNVLHTVMSAANNVNFVT